MRFSLLINTLIFLILHAPGSYQQLIALAKQSNDGTLQAIISGSDLLTSPLPIYLLQFLLVLLVTTGVFIFSQSRFAITVSKVKVVSDHIPNKFIAITLWALICNGALLIVNSAHFIHSFHLTYDFRIWPAVHLNTYVCWVIIAFPTLYLLVKQFRLFWTRIFTVSALLFICLFELTYWQPAPPTLNRSTSQSNEKPNIIIIGIDSLRADLFQSHMPTLYANLKKSVIFESSFTELGRTFPAWNTILTGQYPVTHSARLNLMPREHLPPVEQYLPKQLKENGYSTYFAYDETRFANFSDQYGFDEVISPRIGASDFIVGALSDFPLINLLSLSRYSDWLLPEIYANRAIYKTYRAESFSEKLERKIPTYSGNPTFIAVHFCLPHWPYAFAGAEQPDLNYPEPYFPANLRAVDMQLDRLMASLRKKGYLENSRIVFLSDHGESWKHESLTFKSVDGKEKRRISYGHGSDLTSDTSNRVLIAFKDFKNAEESLQSNHTKLATLADVKPTILKALTDNDDLQFNTPYLNTDGVALQSNNLSDNRIFPVETGTILDLEDEHDNIDVSELVRNMMDRYQLNPDALITIREDAITTALNAKHYGVRDSNELFTKENSGYTYYQLANLEFKSFENLEQASKNTPTPLIDAWCRWQKEPECNLLPAAR